MVSNFPFSCSTVHDGVTRRSVTKLGSGFAALAEAGVVIRTEMSAGVGWNDILAAVDSEYPSGVGERKKS